MAGAPDRPKGPGVTLGVVVLALFVLLTLFTLTARQPAPPSIAEFAPQAVEHITDSPDDLSSRRGASAGLPTPTPPGDAEDLADSLSIDVPRVRRCVGDPPRQTEDPQSPPCVPYWSGDNGGATYKGVSRDRIRIAVPSDPSGEPGTGGRRDISRGMEAFFNSRFEFYGRRLVLIKTGSGAQPAQQIAAAVNADEQLKVFATLENVSVGYHYYEELARRGVMSFAHRSDATEAYLAKRAPYMWRYPLGLDRQFESMGVWACRRLAGQNARFAGDATMALSKRKFGAFLFKPHNDMEIDLEPLKRGLARCGESLAYTYTAAFNQNTDYPGDSQAMLQMRRAGVTTMFYLGSWSNVPMAAASTQSYYPELLVTGFQDLDTNFGAKAGFTADHLQRLMGVTFRPRQVLPQDSPPIWAVQEGDPGWREASEADASSVNHYVQSTYRSLLVLASGIQLAGPRLTPSTLERGLQRAQFPNPDHIVRPGKVGFAGDHTMTQDVAEWYWNASSRGPYSDDAGTICYIDHGNRRPLHSFPAGDSPFFTLPCDSVSPPEL